MKKQHLLRKQADMMDMAELFEIADWRKLVRERMPNQTEFHEYLLGGELLESAEYKFALSVVEGRLVFEGDVVYFGVEARIAKVGGWYGVDGVEKSDLLNHQVLCTYTWQPQKPVTLMVELLREDVEVVLAWPVCSEVTATARIQKACSAALKAEGSE